MEINVPSVIIVQTDHIIRLRCANLHDYGVSIWRTEPMYQAGWNMICIPGQHLMASYLVACSIGADFDSHWATHNVDCLHFTIVVLS